jgi:hypothetical protein
MHPPRLIASHVLRFCESFVSCPKPDPIYVPIEPDDQAKQDSCFPNVEQHVRANGGACVVGWAIWEWNPIFIEAEFHAIWRAPDGRLSDITPKMKRMPRILFLEDHNRQVSQGQVNNKRRSLCRDKDVSRYLNLFTLRFKEMNRGHLARSATCPLTSNLISINREIALLQTKLVERYGPWTSETM